MVKYFSEKLEIKYSYSDNQQCITSMTVTTKQMVNEYAPARPNPLVTLCGVAALKLCTSGAELPKIGCFQVGIPYRCHTPHIVQNRVCRTFVVII